LAAAQAADRQLAQLQAEQAAMQKRYDNLAAREAEAAGRLQHHRQMIKTRAIAIYVTGPGDPVVPAGKDAYEYGRSRMLLKSLHDADVRALNAFRDAKNAAGSQVTKMVDELERFNAKVLEAQQIAHQAKDAADNASSGLTTARATGTIAINGFVFPVGEPHNFIDSFGAPRSGGRTHKGADIFAPYGTPLYACERGFIAKVGVSTLGGIKLWLIGESGTTYFYAHLSAYADGIVDGLLVEAGTPVGYVGNTGNAISTPPHLHFEIHPADGPAINPTYILQAVDNATRAHRNQMLASGQPMPGAGPPVPIGPPTAAAASGGP
jgi:murein DD-endopeptidase MepM/ murein hydrolase activator NlpD